MIVVDASVVAAALVNYEEIGSWARRQLRTDSMLAPHLMPAEVVNVLRKAEIARDISSDSAALAYAALLDLSFELYPFGPFTDRVWQLRAGVSSYDAWYVAMAETFDAILVTLDERLVRAPGPRCRFETFGG